jgi:hypothetical protein
MSIEEQQALKQKNYREAIRYMDNAKEALQKADKEGKYYREAKYVRMACGTAYSGVLVALDAYLALKGIELPKRKRRSIDFYTLNIAKTDGKLLQYVNDVYGILHLSGYYDGILNASVLNEGFDAAAKIIDKIKPMQTAG